MQTTVKAWALSGLWGWAACFMAALLCTACQPNTDTTAVRVGLAQAILTLDPLMATDATSARVNRLLYQGLIDFDAQYRPVAALAADWQALDATHYRFRLKTPLSHFADGTLLTAQDVAATYQAILREDGGSPLKGQLQMLDSVTALDAQTLLFRLKQPDPLFAGRLNIGIVPARALAAGHDFSKQPIGSGTFRFVGWPEPGRVLLERRRDGQRFAFVTVSDPTVRALKIQRGELDLIQNDLPTEVQSYLAERGLSLLRAQGSRYSYMGFNFNDPLSGRLAVRQAVTLAIDRAAIARYLFGDYVKPAWGPMPWGHWAGPLSGTSPAYNPQRAKALLDAAGLADPDGDGLQPRFTLEYKTSTDPLRLRVAAALQAQLRQIGVHLRIRSLDWGTFFGDIKAGRFQVYTLSWVGIESPDLYREAYHSASLPPAGKNRGRLQDATLDSLIDFALANPQQAAPDYGRVQRRLQDVQAYAPLWFEDNIAVLGPRLRGYALDANGDYDGLERIQIAH